MKIPADLKAIQLQLVPGGPWRGRGSSAQKPVSVSANPRQSHPKPHGGGMSGSWEGVLLHISREKNRGGRLVLFSQDSEKNGCQGTHGTAARGCRTIAQDALPTSPVSQPSPVSLGGPSKNPSCQKAVPKAFRRFAPEPTLGPPTCYQGWAF